MQTVMLVYVKTIGTLQQIVELVQQIVKTEEASTLIVLAHVMVSGKVMIVPDVALEIITLVVIEMVTSRKLVMNVNAIVMTFGLVNSVPLVL